MEIKTNFLAEDWLEILQKEVKPNFPDIEFSTWTPDKAMPGVVYSPKILIIMSGKTNFVYSLKGANTTPKVVTESLRRYVFKITKKVMIER